MIYSSFQDKRLSMLGFGAMRLPTQADGTIDQAQVDAMTARAIAGGINYFDTAWPYHDGCSESSIGKALAKFPRESWYLATKYPGHQVTKHYDPKVEFEKQLEKCGVDYFDFYLLHNVNELSIDTYLNPRWGIVPYFREQKRLGRIRHLGFSCHGRIETLERFLDAVGEDMEFCQLQVNYLDWTLQKAEEKVELLQQRGIPVWVMEPVRGGALCRFPEAVESELKALRPEESIPAWGFRFLQDIPGVGVILSGMSNMEQMEDNLRTFEASKPLEPRERELILEIAEGLKDSVPCTGCRYCVPECPLGLEIPNMIATYNDLKVDTRLNCTMWLEAVGPEKHPSACLRCGMCAKMCPQNIDIPAALAGLTEKLKAVTPWTEICRQREEAAAKGN